MDTISLRGSEQNRKRIRNGVAHSSTTERGVWCEGNHKIRPKQATSLPEELVVEMLSHLPPKPFFRCRSVCKHWLSLSSDAFGRNKHLQPTVSSPFQNYYSPDGGSVAAFSYASYGSEQGREW